MTPYGRRLSLLLVLLVITPLTYVPPVHAAGTVSISPSSVPLANTGDTFILTVRVDNILRMNGWDVMVQTNSTVITATSVSIDTSTLGSTSELQQCINGNLIIGNKCSPGDGPGVVHSSAASLGVRSNVNGPLFTITYSVLNGAYPYSYVHLPVESQEVVITDGTNATVTVATTDGAYGSQTPSPDFTINPVPGASAVVQGKSLNTTFILTGNNGIADTVALDASSDPSGLSFTWNDSTPVVVEGASVAVMLTIITSGSTPTTQYTIKVTGTPTMSRYHTVRLPITVQPPGDYILTVSPSQLLIHAGDTGQTTVIISSERGFSDTIKLGVRSDAVGVSVSLNTTTITLHPGGSVGANLIVNTPPANITFLYTLYVSANATHYQLSQVRDLYIKPPVPDIGFSVSSLKLTLKPGDSAALYVRLTSNDYFKGFSYLVATSISGVKLSYSNSTIPLSYYNETFSGIHWVTAGNSTLFLSTDASIPTGEHSLVLAVLSGSLSHSLTVTITISPSQSGTTGSSASARTPVQKLILGLQPVAYFGIIGVLATMLGVAAVLELRRPRSSGRRAFLEDSQPALYNPSKSAEDSPEGKPEEKKE